MSVVIPCLNEAENIEECVTRALARRSTSTGIARRGHRRRQRLRGRQRRARRGRRRARRPRAAARLRQRLPRRLRRRARRLHRHGRRRPDLRLRRDPALRRASSTTGAELVMGDRMDNIQPGRDAVAAPLRRQPGPHRHPQPLLPHRRRATRTAACAAFRRDVLPRSTCARPAWSSPPRWSSAPRRRSSTSASSRSSTTRAAASRSSRRFRDGWRHLRFLLVHSPTHLFIVPGAVLARARRADRR